MEKRPRKKIRLGREARQFLFKCPPDLFFAVHQRAREENKTVNRTLNDLTKLALEMENPMQATR